MLSIQNVTYTKCYLYEMLPRRNVTIQKCTIRNVTIQKCTIRNVTDPRPYSILVVLKQKQKKFADF